MLFGQTRGMLSRGAIVGILASIGLLPMIGAALAQRPLAALFRFPPPLQVPVSYPHWSWLACAAVLAPFAVIALSWLRSEGTSRAQEERFAPPAASARPFPRWGWLAVAWTATWWVLAWTRFAWFAPWQRFTFFPLWVGFIVAVNALTVAASGTCELQRRPREWSELFFVSAGFWWVFEWLNRFVHNWHYLGVEDFGAVAYALHASLCFSTVLPAVAAVSEFLGTRARLREWLSRGPAWRWCERRATGLGLMICGATALLLTGLRPLESYPALWSAPLALAVGAGIFERRVGLWSELARGDWRRIGTWALAALACGWFWECWNFRSAAKWIYTVPYVDRWQVFEMPLLGYLGYLPFGVECLLVVAALQRSEVRR